MVSAALSEEEEEEEEQFGYRRLDRKGQGNQSQKKNDRDNFFLRKWLTKRSIEEREKEKSGNGIKGGIIRRNGRIW